MKCYMFNGHFKMFGKNIVIKYLIRYALNCVIIISLIEYSLLTDLFSAIAGYRRRFITYCQLTI